MCEHELCPLLIFESCALGGTFYMSSISLFTSNYHAKPPIHQDVNRITLVDLLKFHWSKVDMNNEKTPLSLNYSCLIVILTMAYHNPHITGYSIIPNKSPNQPGALFFIAHIQRTPRDGTSTSNPNRRPWPKTVADWREVVLSDLASSIYPRRNARWRNRVPAQTKMTHRN